MKNAYVRLRSLQKQSFCKPRVLLSKTFGSPKPLVLQNLRFSKTSGSPKPKVIQNRRFWKERRGTKANLWIAKLRAKLRFASLTKQSFVWRQTFGLPPSARSFWKHRTTKFLDVV
ncbi:hypothetical protein EON73_00235 [bacterium]|nr:MAG: hypothetical protein EON73_00235 [bacterium]